MCIHSHTLPYMLNAPDEPESPLPLPESPEVVVIVVVVIVAAVIVVDVENAQIHLWNK